MLTGKAFKLGDNISTDDIVPGRLAHLRSNLPELAKHVLEDVAPTLASRIKANDFIVGGENFGLGSSREHAPIVIKIAGASAVLAKSVARIFFRNATNVGLPVIICDTDNIGDGDELEVDLAQGNIRNLTNGTGFACAKPPQVMLTILDEGGLIPYMRKYGGFQGPEVSAAARRVLEATGVEFHWDLAYAGDLAQDMHGTPLPDYVLNSIRQNKVALKGPITTPVGSGFRSVNVALRKALDLYVCLRPCKSYPGVPSRYQDVDIVVFRENTEDLYTGIEYESGTPEMVRLVNLVTETGRGQINPDSNISLRAISRTASRRIVRYAFDYARANNRQKVTAVHKANILKASDGRFLASATEVAKEYPDIGFESAIVDSLCMNLVRHPQNYEVIVLPNLYGDIVSELCAGLIGGLGVAPGANIGDGAAVFEPTHGSAPKYSGQNKANPMAMILSGVMMLRHLGEKEAAERLESAITQVLAEGKSVTYDLKPDCNDPTAVGTSQAADAVIEALGRESHA
jgi:isocitrate dehydrogenase (NAD+)